MKIAPIMTAVEKWNAEASQATPTTSNRRCFEQLLVHTGQHYDERMSHVFFEELGLPRPDYFLEVGSGSHAEMTARVMLAIEPVFLTESPDVVVVVGDVNSTLAATLVAAKLHIPVAHVEAGLRSRDRSMPEELNRLATDQLSDLLLTTSRDADENLLAEGVSEDRVFFVGNTMIDSLERHRTAALARPVLADLGLSAGGYGVVTLHRPSNVDEPGGLTRLMNILAEISADLPLVFPVHARTRRLLEDAGLLTATPARLLLIDPLGYFDFLALMSQAKLMLTDSGGIQEETTVLGIPCLTLRKNTERPVTVWHGTNRLVDPEDEGAVLRAVADVLSQPRCVTPRRPHRWDGHAGDRIIEVIARWLESRSYPFVARGETQEGPQG